jgi:hypothetical protein
MWRINSETRKLKDIEKALETVSATDEFRELVDSYGMLNIDRIEG